jgi:hypothetical protein
MTGHPKQFIRNWKHDLREAFNRAERYYELALDRGAPREVALRDQLERFLPKRYGVTTGHVVSAKPEWSRQADVIIYDAIKCPTFFTGTGIQGTVVPVEAVFGIIEVKSTLDEAQFGDAVEKIAAFKRLCHDETGSVPFTDRFGGIFVYRMPGKCADPAIRDRLLQSCLELALAVPESERQDLAIVLETPNTGGVPIPESYIALRIPSADAGQQPTDFASLPRTMNWWNQGENSVATYLLHLVSLLQNIRTYTPDLFPYLFEEGVDATAGPDQPADASLVKHGLGLSSMREKTAEALKRTPTEGVRPADSKSCT